MRTHDLKIQQPYFDRVLSGAKKAEMRKNDRDFHVGDSLRLREFSAASQSYTGDEITVTVTDALYGPTYGIEDGYVMLSIALRGCPIIHDCGLWNAKLQECTYFTYVDEPFYEDCAAVNLVHSHGLLHIREDSR